MNIKSVGVVGDSVARGLKATVSFPMIIADRLNATLNNQSVSSATFSSSYTNNMIVQAEKVKNCNL